MPMNPVNIVDMSYASTTLQNMAAYAAPIFSSTITPGAFLMGIEIGGVLVAAVIGAVWLGVHNAFFGPKKDKWDVQLSDPRGMKMYELHHGRVFSSYE